MNAVLMWIGGLLAAVLAALFAVPNFVDWNGYRGVFEEEASRILGRDVRVGGKINVRLLPTPYLSFEKLRIADTRLGATEPLFRAESFTLWLSVPPLLQGNLEARHVALEQPVVTLAVDKNGVGNWTTLGIRPGTLPFVPQNVALQAVDVSDGTLVLNHARAGEVGRVSGISGEISAEALNGPYKFAGEVQLAGHTRDVRFVTAKADPDGTIRFKATASLKDLAGAVYKLEGSLTGFSERPEFSGALSATLPLPVLPAAGSGEQTSGQTASSPAPVSQAAVFADVKGQLKADADRLQITQVLASIENVGQPQLLSGELMLEWGRSRRLDFSFTSRWLDLDRLAQGAGRASPIETSATLIEGLTRSLPAQSATRGVVSIDQLTLGGAPLAKLDLAVSSAGAGDLRIERLFAELPAGARLGLDGVLSAAGGDTEFAGVVTASGPSLARLASWGLPAKALADAAPDGPFTLDGRLTIGAKRLALAEVKMRFNDHALTGGVSLERGGALEVHVNAETFESDWLFAGGLKRSKVLDWIDRVASWGSKSNGAGSRLPFDRTGRQESAVRAFNFKLATQTLRGPDHRLRDVIAEIGMQGGDLLINRLAFRVGDGLDVDLDGTIDRRDGKPTGRLIGAIRAEDADAVEAALALFEIPESVRTAQLVDVVPLRLAGDLSLGQRVPDAVDVKADGTAMGGRFTLRTNIDRGLGEDWWAAPAEITASGEETATVHLMDLLFARAGLRAGDARVAGDAARANFAIKAVGIPAQGMVTDAALSREGLSLAYNGRTSVDNSGAVPKLAGTVEVAADRLGDVLALVGVAGSGGSDAAVTGTLGVSLETDGRTKLSPSGLTVAGSELSGALWIARADNGRLKVDGEVAVDQANVPGLVASLVERAPRAVPVSGAGLAFEEERGLWPDQAFAPAAFDRFEGSVAVRFGHLNLASGLGLSGARLRLAFTSGQVAVDLSEAGMLGGVLRGSIVLAKAAAGTRIKSELEARGIELDAIARNVGSSMKSGGSASATLAFAGQALSPRSLMTSIRGNGRVTFVDAWIDGLSPQIVGQVISAAFAKEIGIDSATLEMEISNRLARGRLDIGSRDVDMEVIDGALRLARFESLGKQGRVETLVTVDLSSLQAETEWRLVAAPRSEGKPPWPPVAIYYTGPMGALRSTEPRIALGGFERELTVRRMEYEVEELERLRKLDEENARKERERQRQLEKEQSTPLPQAPGPRSDLRGAGGPGLPVQAQGSQGGAAPAVEVTTPAGVTSGTLEPAAATDLADGTEDAATAANDAPHTAVPWPATPVRRPLRRRAPSAGDTLMRSLNPEFN